jgi:hypothetical protein
MVPSPYNHPAMRIEDGNDPDYVYEQRFTPSDPNPRPYTIPSPSSVPYPVFVRVPKSSPPFFPRGGRKSRRIKRKKSRKQKTRK